MAAVWRSARFRFDDGTRRSLQKADLETLGFGVLQLAFLPFLTNQPVLFAVVLGHFLAVTAVTGASVLLLQLREPSAG